MKNFKTIFKTKAQAKELTSADMLALCIYRTIKAKSEDKAVILDYFIKKAFTAGSVRSDRPYPYHAVTNAQWSLNWQSKAGRKWTGEKFEETSGRVLCEPIEELFDENEVTMFRELLVSVEHYGYKDAKK